MASLDIFKTFIEYHLAMTRKVWDSIDRITEAQFLADDAYSRGSIRNLMVHLANTDSNTATCRASMVVWRKSDEEEFTSHCVYIFQLTKQESDWKISGITQRVLWNEGTSSIHKGAKN